VGQLEKEIQTYHDFDTYLLRDDDSVAGRYFFHSLFVGSTICRDTLTMDDTLCTNRFDFPTLVILELDEHKLSEFIAFALIRDRTTQAFAAFLRWVKSHLGVGGFAWIATQSQPLSSLIGMMESSQRYDSCFPSHESCFVQSVFAKL
jgi:hypothetical protein